MRFPAKKTAGCPKANRAISRQGKCHYPLTIRLLWDFPSSSPRVCTYGRAYGRLPSEPKFLPHFFTHGPGQYKTQTADCGLRTRYKQGGSWDKTWTRPRTHVASFTNNNKNCSLFDDKLKKK